MNKQNNDSTININRYLISINTAIYAVFFLLLPIIYTRQLFETASTPRHILIAIVACLLLLTYSIRFFSGKIELKLTSLHVGFLMFFFWALLSLLWSVDIKNSITELTQLFYYFIIAFIASQLQNKQIQTIFSAIYIGASVAATIGILQAFNFNPLDLKMTTPLASTFNNKNHASVFFDLVIPLALMSMLTTKSYQKHIASIAYTLAVTFILLAKTKGSISGYIVFSLFFLVFIYKNNSIQKQLFHKKNIIHYLLLSFIIPLSIYTLANTKINTTSTTTTTTSKTASIPWNADLTKNSVNTRMSWYKNAYAMLEDNPVAGVGYGGFRKGFAPYASAPNVVKSLTEDQAVAQLHNDPYQNILELGLIGGALIILIFCYIVFKSSFLLSTTEIKNKSSPYYLLLGSFLALISSITHSLTDFPMRLPSSAALFWFLTGVIILLINNSDSKIILKKQSQRILPGIFLLFLCIVLSTHSYDLYHRHFLASKFVYQATVSYTKEKNCSKARNEIDQAINLFFANDFIRQRYVQVYSSCNLSPQITLSAMNRVLNYDSTNARARLTRATLLLNNKNFTAARTDFSYLTYVLPHRPAAYLGLGDIATLQKDFKNARKYYEKAKSLEPKNKKALFMLKQFDEKGV